MVAESPGKHLVRRAACPRVKDRLQSLSSEIRRCDLLGLCDAQVRLLVKFGGLPLLLLGEKAIERPLVGDVDNAARDGKVD